MLQEGGLEPPTIGSVALYSTTARYSLVIKSQNFNIIIFVTKFSVYLYIYSAMYI
jgi:hypothetical protein